MIMKSPNSDKMIMEITDMAQDILNRSRNVIILAGAGMSAELGTPVYYTGDNSRYGDEKSVYGYTALEHAFAPLWDNDRESQKKYSHDRWESMLAVDVSQTTSPYPQLLNYLQSHNKDYFVATSNVDSAFIRTGYDESKVLEIHGSSRVSQCLEEPTVHGIFPTQEQSSGFTSCPTCGGDTRPNTMYFVDFDFNPALLTQQQDAYVDFIEKCNPEETVVLEIGAGETVATLRNYSKKLNLLYGFDLIRINPQDDTVSMGENTSLLPLSFLNVRHPGDFIHLQQGTNQAFNVILNP
jgi:NAD-dependent SIR2 family protein deacetylase